MLPEGSPAWTLSRREVAQRPVAQGGATLHFVDDRYETMQAIAEQAPDLLGRWVPAGVPPAAAAPARPGWVATGVCSLETSCAAAWKRLCGRLPACARSSDHPCTQKYNSILLSSPSSYKLWLADWGYNTAEERAAAAALPGVRLLSRPQFCELLKWGVVMEVGGRQPLWPAA